MTDTAVCGTIAPDASVTVPVMVAVVVSCARQTGDAHTLAATNAKNNSE